MFKGEVLKHQFHGFPMTLTGFWHIPAYHDNRLGNTRSWAIHGIHHTSHDISVRNMSHNLFFCQGLRDKLLPELKSNGVDTGFKFIMKIDCSSNFSMYLLWLRYNTSRILSLKISIPIIFSASPRSFTSNSLPNNFFKLSTSIISLQATNISLT